MEETIPALQTGDDLARAKGVVAELLRTGGGRVSTQRVRQQLEQLGISDSQKVIAGLKFSDADIPFRHHGRSFYTPEAFQALTVEIDGASAAAEAAESAAVAAEGLDPQRSARRQEEARLGRYVLEELTSIYAAESLQGSEYVFDVHQRRAGSDYENVDLIAVHWRNRAIVELVAVEVKLGFTAKLIQQASNYRRFANRVWIAVPVEAQLLDAVAALRECNPLLFEHAVDLGLGILACRRGRGGRYEVAAVHWPRRIQPDPVERAEFVERFRDVFEAAGILGPTERVRPVLG